MKGRYSPELLNHFHLPRNPWDGKQHPGLRILECGEPEKGEIIVLYLLADDQRGTIKRCWFRAAGSVETIGIGSWVTTYVPGKRVREILENLEGDARSALGLTPNQWRVTKWLARLFDKLDEEMQI